MNIKQLTTDYFVNKPVKSVYLFGSYARNEANENSDIDLLLDIDYKAQAVDILDLYDWSIELGKIFNHKVDLIASDGVSKFMLPFIENDKTLIYAK